MATCDAAKGCDETATVEVEVLEYGNLIGVAGYCGRHINYYLRRYRGGEGVRWWFRVKENSTSPISDDTSDTKG